MGILMLLSHGKRFQIPIVCSDMTRGLELVLWRCLLRTSTASLEYYMVFDKTNKLVKRISAHPVFLEKLIVSKKGDFPSFLALLKIFPEVIH